MLDVPPLLRRYVWSALLEVKGKHIRGMSKPRVICNEILCPLSFTVWDDIGNKAFCTSKFFFGWCSKFHCNRLLQSRAIQKPRAFLIESLRSVDLIALNQINIDV